MKNDPYQKNLKSTNRRWQNHLKAKGPIAFFMDRLKAHALSSSWQYNKGPFFFPIDDREKDDELTKAFFALSEEFPIEFFIEITNNCNLSCKMCARSKMRRPKGFMTNKLFKKIIDEIVKKQKYAYIHLYGIGEPLLDRNLFWKLKYARQRGISNMILFTNGQLLLRDELYKKLADSGISSIGVDLDGFSQRTYGQIRIGGKFSLAKKGIEKAYSYIRKQKLNTRVEVAYQVYPEINETDIPQFINWCNKNDYEYKIVTMHNWAGLRQDIPQTRIKGLIDMHHKKRTCPCCALWTDFMINWDGKVGLCFQDADTRELLGDITNQTIEEVWKSKHLMKRRKHVAGIFDGLCKNCDSNTDVTLPKNKKSQLYPKSLRS